MKTKIAKLVTLVSFAAILLMLSAVQAMACSCAGTKEPCQAYGEASAVFIGTVINIRTVAKKEDSYNGRAVRFQIDSDFRGAEGAEIEVLTGFGDADCGFRFTQSQQYLVYAYEYKGTLSTGICTRTRTLKTADDDLRYFSGLATAKPGAKISGKVVRYRRTDSGQLEEPLPGISILINGPQTLEVKSNAQGEYAIEGLTPGDYTVKVALPAGMDAQGAAEQKALVIDHGCAVIDFWLAPEGNLSGLVIDPRGLPVNKENEPMKAYTSSLTMSSLGLLLVLQFCGPASFNAAPIKDSKPILSGAPHAIVSEGQVATGGDFKLPSSWKNLIPLQTTREEVESILGTPKISENSRQIFENDTERVEVLYSTGRCEPFAGRWNVAPGVVVVVYVYPKKNIQLKSLHLDENKYVRQPWSHPNDWVTYRNQQEGIEVDTIVYGGTVEEVRRFSYGPSAKDVNLSCKNEVKPYTSYEVSR